MDIFKSNHGIGNLYLKNSYIIANYEGKKYFNLLGSIKNTINFPRILFWKLTLLSSVTTEHDKHTLIYFCTLFLLLFIPYVILVCCFFLILIFLVFLFWYLIMQRISDFRRNRRVLVSECVINLSLPLKYMYKSVNTYYTYSYITQL